VPTPVAVHAYPVGTVSYATHYYAPMVPVASHVSWVTAPVTVVRPTVVAPLVAPVVYRRPYYRPRRFRGMEIEIERDGDIEIDYR
jgi:hypothetical protein